MAYYTEENSNNWMEITRLDSANRIVSGVFQFDLVSDEVDMDTIKVRDGRFDLEFTLLINI